MKAYSSGGCVSGFLFANLFLVTLVWGEDPSHDHHDHEGGPLAFSIRSIRDGDWSDRRVWDPQRIPAKNDRVLVLRGTDVRYDVASKDILRMVHVVGTLRFARDRDTLLNVGILKVQDSDTCTESGFACEFDGGKRDGPMPALIVGADNPIPAEHTARIRLHYIEGMNKDDAPAIACCSARMEIHGSPLSRTWLKLDGDAKPGDQVLTLWEEIDGWKIGDEVIVTASHREGESQTENRHIVQIAGRTITLDDPLEHEHFGSGEFRSEVANLSRNVIIESADPGGVRGHTVYHRGSAGGISYARFAYLGKRGVLGRYAIHYHLVGSTMRGSSVLGAAIVDSHNRWVTVHGNGATWSFAIVSATKAWDTVFSWKTAPKSTTCWITIWQSLRLRGRPLPDQVLSFDPNDGAAFWWANGKNTFTRNVSCENEEYGYRYDMQKTSRLDTNLPIVQPDGSTKTVDVRTIPIWRFEDNEVHTEGFYGMVVAANGNRQPDNAIRDQKMLRQIKAIDWTAPDRRHPHVIKNFTVWNAHYAFRPHSPNMLMENVRLHRAAYGIYRPAFENHVYRNLHITDMGAEPFNRGMDDASAQTGVITVDGLTFGHGYGNKSTPLVQISDLNLSGDAATHFRNVTVDKPEQFRDRWPLINRGVGPRVPPITGGVPIFIHDYFGPGRHVKVVSTAAQDLLDDGNQYRQIPTITGDESLAAEVTGIQWPDKLLDPVDDEPPATIITSVVKESDQWIVSGLSHDNGVIKRVSVNGKPAGQRSSRAGVVDWTIALVDLPENTITAAAQDDAGNQELTPHVWTVRW